MSQLCLFIPQNFFRVCVMFIGHAGCVLCVVTWHGIYLDERAEVVILTPEGKRRATVPFLASGLGSSDLRIHDAQGEAEFQSAFMPVCAFWFLCHRFQLACYGRGIFIMSSSKGR